MMNFREKKRRNVTINITSLIDVVLLLLIFFMLTTTFSEQPGMKLELPEAKSFGTQRFSQLEVSIGADGTLVLNGNKIATEDLKQAITDLVPQIEEKTIILRADKAVQHGVVVMVMDVARSAGIEKVVIAAKPR